MFLGQTVESREPDLRIPLLEAERWWGGAVDDAAHQPYGDQDFSRDLAQVHPSEDGAGAPSNQAAPILVSTRGRNVSSDRPFRFAFTPEELKVWGENLRFVGERPASPDASTLSGQTLAAAFMDLAENVWTPSGAPDRALFTGPQYNTWIEMPLHPTQEKVLDYVRNMLDCGMPPGVVMIDDLWARDYGSWQFDLAAFPDPAAMVRTLHEWGCAVMLWVVPFVSPDSFEFRELEKAGYLLKDEHGQTALRRWWNGISACLDLSNECALKWLKEQLDELRRSYGIDGFKFDAGDVRDYRDTDQTNGLSPVEMCEAWGKFGTNYPLNEYRACWKMAGAPLAQRLQDKPPTWDERGIGALIPEMLTQAMIGCAYVSPDMIGGGEIVAMTAAGGIDQELFVRYAQIAALSPMMQFSVSPARVLDEPAFDALQKALNLRERYLPYLMELVEHCATDGTPIMRPMSYHDDSLEAAQCRDQFMLGEDLVIAPVLTAGATSRKVYLPAGKWEENETQQVLEGGQFVEIPVVLDTLPIFESVKE
ncbi:hypothetical protein BSR28_00360 [Boudabousia liubingyangii]|uniref:glycoside hydrolase family 31 protein n=1 Tax=Boudabousia liubingyangii TaxID=1921764 RepID=UPI00093D3BBA|nr:glycoside hydrolase family 31 protein [Boudabousia liubingyangii]OKL48203.1 hypothetical protein BSR28_00360 [Boudabousia liubingyangii]